MDATLPYYSPNLIHPISNEIIGRGAPGMGVSFASFLQREWDNVSLQILDGNRLIILSRDLYDRLQEGRIFFLDRAQ